MSPHLVGGNSVPGQLPQKPVGIKGLMSDVHTPNAYVTQPEQVQSSSLAFSPEFRTDHTAYLTGTDGCLCPPVLFVTTDAGATWVKLPAAGLKYERLLLSPEPSRDRRIFALGMEGIQVSRDGGNTFQMVTAGLFGAGSTISPRFSRGDPRIRVTANPHVELIDGSPLYVPMRSPLVQRVRPYFSPAESEEFVFHAGIHPSGPDTQTWPSAVARCDRAGLNCLVSPLDIVDGEPEIRFASDYAASGRLYAFTQSAVFRSTDRGRSFTRLGTWDAVVGDVNELENGTFLVGVWAPAHPPGLGLHALAPGGQGWTHLDLPLLNKGVVAVESSGDTVMAAQLGGGVACSSDGGRHWFARCSPAA